MSWKALKIALSFSLLGWSGPALGRHSKRNDCTFRSISFSAIEELIQDLYDKLGLKPSYTLQLRTLLAGQLKQLRVDADQRTETLSAQKLEIERKQLKLLEAHYNDAIPGSMLASEQKSLDAQLASINKELDALSGDLTESEYLINLALDLAQDSADAYRSAPEHIKRMFNQILFDRIEILMDYDDNHQLQVALAPPFDELFGADLRRIVARLSDHNDGQKDVPAITGGDIPDNYSISLALVSNKSNMVGLTGFEPATT